MNASRTNTDSTARLDTITLRGLTARGNHGVLPHERLEGQSFVVDVVLYLDTRAAAIADDLALTVDYGRIAAATVGIIAGEPFDLIETVADRIATMCLAEAAVAQVEVTVHKPEAPVSVQFDDIAVTVMRRR